MTGKNLELIKQLMTEEVFLEGLILGLQDIEDKRIVRHRIDAIRSLMNEIESLNINQ